MIADVWADWKARWQAASRVALAISFFVTGASWGHQATVYGWLSETIQLVVAIVVVFTALTILIHIKGDRTP